MAITRVGTETTAVVSDTFVSTIDVTSHTVPSGASMLLIATGFRGDRTASIENWNTSEVFTQIYHHDFATATNDTGLAIFGLVNPTATTDTITVTFSGLTSFAWAAMVNYDGTNTDSVAAASNFISEDENDGATSTTVLTSGGTAGNALLAIASFVGADGDPVSNDQTWTEVLEADTGGVDSDVGDATYYWAEDLNISAASGCTITWNVSDENVGALIELVAESGTNTSILVPTGPLR